MAQPAPSRTTLLPPLRTVALASRRAHKATKYADSSLKLVSASMAINAFSLTLPQERKVLPRPQALLPPHLLPHLSPRPFPHRHPPQQAKLGDLAASLPSMENAVCRTSATSRTLLIPTALPPLALLAVIFNKALAHSALSAGTLMNLRQIKQVCFDLLMKKIQRKRCSWGILDFKRGP